MLLLHQMENLPKIKLIYLVNILYHPNLAYFTFHHLFYDFKIHQLRSSDTKLMIDIDAMLNIDNSRLVFYLSCIINPYPDYIFNEKMIAVVG